MNKLNKALQVNKALEFLAQGLELEETQSMEIADLYPNWKTGIVYKPKDIVKYGTNADGETQLYSVQQGHTSQSDWTPDTVPALFKAIGFTEDETPIWTQPLGGHDAYQKGDIVSHNGVKYISTADNNVWEPGVYGWEEQ